jgi:hypothetical protein
MRKQTHEQIRLVKDFRVREKFPLFRLPLSQATPAAGAVRFACHAL